jgi:hypothetical protein
LLGTKDYVVVVVVVTVGGQIADLHNPLIGARFLRFFVLPCLSSVYVLIFIQTTVRISYFQFLFLEVSLKIQLLSSIIGILQSSE